MNIKLYITFSFLFAPFCLPLRTNEKKTPSLFALSVIMLKTYSTAATIR